MADQQPDEGSSASYVSGGNPESTVELNIKTLDSRIFSFQVDKNIGILAFKEKIAGQSGVAVRQQRLIFRGKVLKDDHLLSEYNVENGDTLHLVERQPQPSAGSGAGDATPSNLSSRGHDSTAGGLRGRIGQVAHSVVLGTVNVGDSGEAMGPDLSRVIGAVLNSIGIGNLAAGMQPNVQVQTSQGHETEGSQTHAGSQSQGGNQSAPWRSMQGQSNPMPVPFGNMVALPLLNMPIPDSLNTLVEYMNRMGPALSENAPTSDSPAPALPTNSRGVPTVEALSIVLRHAQRLLSDHAVGAISHSAGRLEQEGASTDPTVRGQVQTEVMRLGVAMQHLGALLLELGRTILTLRMGQTQAESFVNAGPAVYISPSGPNPIMVQPFPLQTSSLFGGPTSVASNPVPMGPVGVGNTPRSVNIHIHTGAPLVPMVSSDNREGTQGEHASGPDSGPGRLLSGLNVTAAGSRPAVVSISGTIQPSIGVPADSNSTGVAEINNHIRNLVSSMNSDIPASSDSLNGQGPAVDSVARNDDRSSLRMTLAGSRIGDSGQALPRGMNDPKQPHTTNLGSVSNSTDEPSTITKGSFLNLSTSSEHPKNVEGPTRSSQGNDKVDGSAGVPIGLGLGGLQPKRDKQRGQAKNSNAATAANQNQQSSAIGQRILQSLASLPQGRNDNISPPGQSPDLTQEVSGNVATARENTDGPIDMANAVSEALESSALDGLLAGVSQQTGIGSPDMMRNMLRQFTQNPAMRNTMNQIAQQIDSNDLGSMFAGMGRGQGGGIDLSRMMQQMMPIVSQALGGVSSASPPSHAAGPVLLDSRSRRDATPNRNTQIDLQRVVQTLESQSSPQEIFRSVAGTAADVLGDSTVGVSIVNEVCGQEELLEEFVDMLRGDVSRRLEDDKGPKGH